MKVTVLLIVSICFLSILKVSAQEEELLAVSEEKLIETIGTDNEYLKEYIKNQTVNEAFIQQIGAQNQISLNQTLSGGVAKSNIAIFMQEGSFNIATLNQNGSGNGFKLKQHGDQNEYLGDISGHLNLSTIIQNGQENRIDQGLSGNELNYYLIQNGNSNTIVQKEASAETALPAYKIQQNGNGMTLMITNGVIPLP